MLAIVMILGSIEFNYAAEPLYYYDKYSVKKLYELFEGTNMQQVYTISHNPLCAPLPEAYNSLGINSNGNIYGIGEENPWNGKPVGMYLKTSGGGFYRVVAYRGSVNTDCIDCGRIRRDNLDAYPLHTKEVGNAKDLIVQANITGTATQYPADGIHIDGYWYIRKELVNQNPTITVTNPAQNGYFSKNILV